MLAAIALGFLPSTRDPSLPAPQRAKAIVRGNQIGAALSLLTLALAFLAILTQFLSFSATSGEERAEFFERLYSPASALLTWFQIITFGIVLSAYLASPRRPKSMVVVLSLALLICVETYFSLFPFFERRPVVAAMPVQLLFASHYLARVLNYFGMIGLCIGLLAQRRPADAPVV